MGRHSDQQYVPANRGGRPHHSANVFHKQLQNGAYQQATHQQATWNVQSLTYHQPHHPQDPAHQYTAYPQHQQIASYHQQNHYVNPQVATHQPNNIWHQYYAGGPQSASYGHPQIGPQLPPSYFQTHPVDGSQANHYNRQQIGPPFPTASGYRFPAHGVQRTPYYQQQPHYPVMAYSQWNNAQYSQPQYNYQYPPGYDAYAQQQQQPQQYQADAPQIRNPFAPPPAARSNYATQNAEHDPEYEAKVAQWQSAYAPQDQLDRSKKGSGRGGEKGENPNLSEIGSRQGPAQNKGEGNAAAAKPEDGEKKRTVVRKGGGQSWEDDTLLEWDPTQFRIMVGNLAGEVTDDSLAKAFAQYGVSKARVVRDKRTTKSKGYGFVSFTDGELGFKAAREMVGKYIGSHPVTIERSKTDLRPVTRKDKDKDKGKHKGKNHGGKNQNDPLKANTGAHIEKKPVKNPAYKILG